MVWEVVTQSAVSVDSTHETVQSSVPQMEHTGIFSFGCLFLLTIL